MSIKAAFFVPHPPLIVPSVGKGKERGIAATIESYNRVSREIASLEPETIILISPHAQLYRDFFRVSCDDINLNLRNFGAEETVSAECDKELAEKISVLCYENAFPAGVDGNKTSSHDHGAFVPLYFVNRRYSDYKLLIISPSGLSHGDHFGFGVFLKNAVEALGREVVIIASGDLSHRLAEDGPYGFAPEGPVLDKTLTDIMRRGDLRSLLEVGEGLCERGGECGMRPLLILAGALDSFAISSKLLSYEGPFGVGYAVAVFQISGSQAYEPESEYARLAKNTLEIYVKEGRIAPLPEGLPQEMLTKKAGVFVSLKRYGQLRGCIGTISPATGSVAEEIRQNAVSSGTRDPRFNPVSPEELPDLVYSVDVLGEAEPCSRDMLDPSRYGVIVSRGIRRGLLLPMLDGVDTVDYQIDIARQKAGIGKNEEYTLERFEVVRYK